MADLTVYRGNTITYTLTVTRDSAPVDLTSASIYFTVKTSVGLTDACAVFQKTTGSGVTITSASGGIATVVIDPIDTASVTGGTYDTSVDLLYDVKVIESGGVETTVALGKFTVILTITQTY